ncbi:MAG: hypothetical protein IBX64_13110 [Actinobacteria bacterium]|nr:hypothetical protein [Actinomycetota bacterium]
MKRLLLLSMIVFLLLPSSISLASVPEEVDQIIKENLASIIGDIEQKPDIWGVKDPSDVPMRLGQPYQVYSLDLGKVKTSAKNYKKGGIDSFLWPDPYWEYPLFAKNGRVVVFAQVYKEDGAWAFRGMGPYLPEPNKALEFFSADEDAILKYLSKQGIGNVNTIKRLENEAFCVNFIYVDAEKGDYLIPLFSGIKRIALEEKKVYPAADVLAKITKELNQLAEAYPRGDMAGGAGSDDQEYPTSMAVIVPIAVALIAILASVGIILARRKSHMSDS